MTAKERVTAAFSKHLEGWQAGALAVGVAAIGVLFAAPRAIAPDEVPLPIANVSVLAGVHRASIAKARALAAEPEAKKGGPDYDLRRLGDALRAFGAADVAVDKEKLADARQRINDSIASIPADRLAMLEAYEEGIFLRELAAWEATGEASKDLGEVGGDFLTLAKRSHWVTGEHHLSPSDDVRAALFKRRFLEVTGRRDDSLRLSLDESRALYAFWLLNPPPSTGATLASTDPAIAASDIDRWRYRKVEELAVIDPTYPADLARGVLLYRLSDWRGSAKAFREHLAAHQDGPYTLRARNWLVAAQAKIDEG